MIFKRTDLEEVEVEVTEVLVVEDLIERRPVVHVLHCTRLKVCLRQI